MPELPDVETFKRYVDSTSLHKMVNRVEVKDKQVLDVSAQTLRRRIENKQFQEAQRVGKYLFIDADSDTWLVLHFGMTGNVKYQHEEDYPRHSRIVFHFDGNGYLAYICQRKFGSVDVADDLSKFKNGRNLGEDALEVDWETFRSLLNKKRSMVKSALMDQKTIAGIGNVYSDEILYQCKIHPETKTGDLDEDQIRDLYNTMRRIFRTSINNNADPDEMPNRYLISHRSEGEECPDCGGEIKRIKVSGRGCYICPGCQKTS